MPSFFGIGPSHERRAKTPFPHTLTQKWYSESDVYLFPVANLWFRTFGFEDCVVSLSLTLTLIHREPEWRYCWDPINIRNIFLSYNIVFHYQTNIYLFFVPSFFFYFEYFGKKNERLSCSCKNGEMLCLCVQFENSNLQLFKLKNKNCRVSNHRLPNELAGNFNSIEYLTNEKILERTLNSYCEDVPFFFGFS